ncbi:MAG TPA: helix-turn-helix domain-containing protein [Steroidobacteraceae bacterium]|nr:helix-turn-helix domain-containing protein [Steroidobacteraceae bacterium]
MRDVPPRLQTFTHSSPIGHWSVSVWRTDPRLADVVTSLWFGEGKTAYQRDRILPSGQSQLLINLGPAQYRIEPGPPEVRVPFVDIWYSGLHQRPIDTEAPHGNALLGVAFSAHGTFPWLGERMDGLSDRIIALADALGDGALRLRERLLNTPSLEARFSCVERWLIGRLKPRTIIHPAVRWAVDQLAASVGRMPIEQLATQTGFTRKHLGNLFQQQVGLTPKALARVHRFRGALQLLDRADGQVPWAQLADQCGFYDQSHLINEFRRFTGLSPVELVRRERPDSGSIVLR